MLDFIHLPGSSRPKTQYSYLHQLVGHSSGVHNLTANYSGTLLASGGEELPQ
jgi:hypothetical protein